LIKIGFLKKQRFEIAVVLLELCGNEKVYNPYYTLLGENLTKHERNIKI